MALGKGNATISLLSSKPGKFIYRLGYYVLIHGNNTRQVADFNYSTRQGDIIRTIRDNIQYIAHFHTGGNPGRNELDDTQELNWRTIAMAIADLGFQGYFAHEFVPKRDPLASLREAVMLCDV